MALRRILKRLGVLFLVMLGLLVSAGGVGWWYFHPETSGVETVVYGRRGERDLTFDRLRPASADGKALVVMVSGGWRSDRAQFPLWVTASFLRRGFTVFAVSHVSQPDASVMETVEDVHRAVRFIRAHAVAYGIDPQRIGVIGASSGGHLSLMLATQAGIGPLNPADPVDQQSSRVQAATLFFPVTDLLNLGDSTENLHDGGPPKHFVKSFGPDGQDLEKWKVIGASMSPILHITPELPPILIHHGDADTLTPLDQSVRFQKAAEDAGARSVEIVVRPGKGHGWGTILWDTAQFAGWMDRELPCETR